MVSLDMVGNEGESGIWFGDHLHIIVHNWDHMRASILPMIQSMFMNKLSSHIGSALPRKIMPLECIIKSELGTCDPPDVFRFQLPLNQASESVVGDDRNSVPKISKQCNFSAFLVIIKIRYFYYLPFMKVNNLVKNMQTYS